MSHVSYAASDKCHICELLYLKKVSFIKLSKRSYLSNFKEIMKFSKFGNHFKINLNSKHLKKDMIHYHIWYEACDIWHKKKTRQEKFFYKILFFFLYFAEFCSLVFYLKQETIFYRNNEKYESFLVNNRIYIPCVKS